MEKLKENSIHINGTIVACWPQYGEKEAVIDVTNTRNEFNNCYAVNNSVICFVADHEVYVTHYTREAIATLEEAGLVKKHFYVPFSNWDYPKYEKCKWEHLRELADESYYRNYERDSVQWCDEYGIGELSEDVMRRCFKIPRSGVPIKNPNYESTYYPACNEFYVDRAVIDKLGRYCVNNGVVVFVYRDGHTYVASGYWIIKELHRAGFKKSALFVPFSNGEQITDSGLAAEWQRVSVGR